MRDASAGPPPRPAGGPQEEDTMNPATLEHISDVKAGFR
ncbi:hypothetical protein RKD27_002312 [Streptomyces sp. SAI-126]|nr:hypothetical protein [Streptomyces sp. SAI-119]MDH6495926.1 hypothetical protein [Streptomyces sp. SAI-149]